MATANVNRFLRRLARGMVAETLIDKSDRELVARFLARQDEAVFETLMRRHGPMVYRVCWRVLQHSQDAEDAFQAAFLVLAQKLKTVRKRDSLASWLHGVAHRLALKAKAHAARRREHERRASASRTAPPDEATWAELRTVLDAELTRLPDRLRLPLILCYLEGRTQDEAARQLGWSKSTLLRRLEEARTTLGRRLTRRGVVWPAATSAVLLSHCIVPAAPPPALLGPTIEAAACVAAGRAATAGLVSARVAALVKGAMDAMLTSQFNAGAILLAVVCGLWAGAGVLTQQALGARQPAAESKKAAAAEPTPPTPQPQDKPGRLLFYRAGQLTLIGPDGKDEKPISKDRGDFLPSDARLSPDGKRIAFTVQVEKEPAPGRDPRRKVYVRGLDEPEPGTDLKVEGQQVCWSPDGAQLVVVDYVFGDDPKDVKFVNWLVDMKTKEKTALKLPDNHAVIDWSRDDKHFLTLTYEPGKPGGRLHLMNRDGTKSEALTGETERVYAGRLSPDGHQLLYLAPDPERKGKEGLVIGLGLFVLDAGKHKAVRVEGQPLNGEFMGFCWSPDGKHIAYAWRELPRGEGPNQETESQLIVADADGNNSVSIASEKADNTGAITIMGIDWR